MDGEALARRKTPRKTRAERLAAMDTVYALARKGDIPATRVGREWRFARSNLISWVANGSQADQLAAALRNGRVGKGRR
jgi:excisionase family DNA binding protein